MGKKKSKTKTVSTPWAPMQPYILGAAGTMDDIVKQNQPKLDSLTNDLTGMLPQMRAMAMGPQPGLTAAQGYVGDVLGGKYLNANPYIDGMVHRSEQDAGNAVNSTFSMAGRTGGGNHAEDLARGVADASNQLRYTNYASERANQTAAAGLLPSLTQAQYAGIMPYLSSVELAGNLPYAGVGALSPMLGLAAGSGTSKTTEKKGVLQSLQEAAAAAAAAYAQSGSDPRIKENVVKVGDLAPGLGLYEWHYRKDMGFELPEGRYRGVMANEIARVAPWMLGTPVNGYMTVRYTPERIGE